MATKTRPCIVLYRVTGNQRKMCDEPIGVAGFFIASILKLHLNNNDQNSKILYRLCQSDLDRQPTAIDFDLATTIILLSSIDN